MSDPLPELIDVADTRVTPLLQPPQTIKSADDDFVVVVSKRKRQTQESMEIEPNDTKKNDAKETEPSGEYEDDEEAETRIHDLINESRLQVEDEEKDNKKKIKFPAISGDKLTVSDMNVLFFNTFAH
jgi:hypothetical protein